MQVKINYTKITAWALMTRFGLTAKTTWGVLTFQLHECTTPWYQKLELLQRINKFEPTFQVNKLNLPWLKSLCQFMVCGDLCQWMNSFLFHCGGDSLLVLFNYIWSKRGQIYVASGDRLEEQQNFKAKFESCWNLKVNVGTCT